MPRVSAGDSEYVHPYLIPRKYIQIASERLANDKGSLGPKYRKLLAKQIADCYKEMGKRAL
jgi:hypothetical protein